ncbi:Kelch repeat-containing protein [Pontibacter sp. CAU 1760]
MRLLTSLFFLLTLCVFTSCDSDNEDDFFNDWTAKANFAGTARTGAVAFTIDGKAYVGTGFDGENMLGDFWQYDAAQDIWTKLPDFPGEARTGAVGFAVNGKGYVGTGYNGSQNLKDFWVFSPATNTWEQLPDFPGTARYGAISMMLGNSGYLGGGYDGAYLKDFWQLDPATGTWTEKPGFSGARRVNGFAFAVNGKGYVGGGRNSTIQEADFMEYDPATSTWRNLKSLNELERSKTDYPAPRAYTSTFVLNNKAYLVGGSIGTSPATAQPVRDVWQYNPQSDTWQQLDAFAGAWREGAIGFSIGDLGYIGLGRNGSQRYKDLWQLDVSEGGK